MHGCGGWRNRRQVDVALRWQAVVLVGVPAIQVAAGQEWDQLPHQRAALGKAGWNISQSGCCGTVGVRNRIGVGLCSVPVCAKCPAAHLCCVSGPYAAAALSSSARSCAGWKPGGGVYRRHTTNASMLLLRLLLGLTTAGHGVGVEARPRLQHLARWPCLWPPCKLLAWSTLPSKPAALTGYIREEDFELRVQQ